MNILIVHSEITKHSGSGRYFYDLIRGLSEKGYSINVLSFEIDDSLKVVPGLRVFNLRRLSMLPIFWRFQYFFELLHILIQIIRYKNIGNFDVLIGSDLLFCKSVLTLYGKGKKFIYTPLSMIAPIEIGSYGFTGASRAFSVNLYRLLQRWALLRCDRVVRFTESAVSALENYYGLRIRHKSLISVYVSREFEDVHKDLNYLLSKKDQQEILWVGRLIKSKNVQFLLRAVARLKSAKWKLSICSDGPQKKSLVKLARELGVQSKVRFLGFVKNLSELYSRSSIFVTASLLEQYSLTLMEAYQHAVPCIGLKPDWKTVFNSNEDQIIDGVTGFLVTDEKEMAEKIDYLLENPERCIEMGKNAYRFKRKNYSFEDYIHNFTRALESI